uniref:RNase H type-1 domain-containing protein n=1 Tax=Nicotiana tabacum TaxID=4097 RepID=A0A1S3XRR5_TOBAC|nr:PREDICTED: uncharacterized protein LOC107768046 [Nicotiana tabacum]
MGPAGRDSRSKQENPRYGSRSRDRDAGSSSKFRKERDERDNNVNIKSKIGDYSFYISTSELVAILKSIEVNVAQIKAIEEILDILTSKKEVQRLTGRISALGRFISRSSEKSFKFFLVLKKKNQFEWIDECQQALKNLKAYLSNPPLVAKPKDGEKLPIYLTASEMAVSAVLVLADFMADFSPGIILEVEKELQVFIRSNPGTWTLFTDGASNVKGAGLGIILISSSGETIRQTIKCHPITNNGAEYEDVIAGLKLVRELGIEQIIIKSDSQLVVNQMQGTYTAKEARMQQYLEKARELQTIPIVENRANTKEESVEADVLANLASVAEVTNEENATYGILADDKKKAQSLRQKFAHYCLILVNLYRKMFGGPLERCHGPSQTEYMVRDVHEGHYGNHAVERSLVKLLIRAGYYWPKMEEDAESFLAKYDKCQRYGNNMHCPVELLHPVISPWPFMK